MSSIKCVQFRKTLQRAAVLMFISGSSDRLTAIADWWLWSVELITCVCSWSRDVSGDRHDLHTQHHRPAGELKVQRASSTQQKQHTSVVSHPIIYNQTNFRPSPVYNNVNKHFHTVCVIKANIHRYSNIQKLAVSVVRTESTKILLESRWWMELQIVVKWLTIYIYVYY